MLLCVGDIYSEISIASGVALVFIKNPSGRSDYVPKHKDGSYTYNVGQSQNKRSYEVCQ